MYKRGFSNVVVAVLLILIAIAGVAIAWVFISPLIRNAGNGLNTGQECLTLDLEIVNCQTDGEEVAIAVRKNSDQDLNDLRFILKNMNGEVILRASEAIFGSIPSTLETKLFYFSDNDYQNVNVAGIIGGTLCQPSSLPVQCVQVDEIVTPEETWPNTGSDNNFEFVFNNGIFTRLNWDNGQEITISEDTSNRKVYLHSRSGAGTNTGWELKSIGQDYTARDFDFDFNFGTIISDNHTAITYTTLYEDDRLIRSSAESVNLRVEDTIAFAGDTIYITSKITNKRSDRISVNVPVYLGGLTLDNSQRTQIIPDKGGKIRQGTQFKDFSMPYPEGIKAFSPTAAVWDGRYTLGMQHLAELELPTYVEIEIDDNDGQSERLDSRIITDLNPGESKNFLMAFKLANPGNWQGSLDLYKEWFYDQYGDTPHYCPTGPFGFSAGINNPEYQGNPDWIFERGSTFGDLYYNRLDNAYDVELPLFGIWRTGTWTGHLNSSCSAELANGTICEDEDDPLCEVALDCGQTANANLISPNLDISIDTQLISDYVTQIRNNGTDAFWYTRSCSWVYGASQSYQNGVPVFTEGEYVKKIDLRQTGNKDLIENQWRFLLDKNVTGIYIDYTSCPGEYEYLKSMSDELKEEYPGFFFIREGSRDKYALEVPQLVVLTQGNYPHSEMIRWLLPKATFYRGKIGSSQLSDGEIDQILEEYEYQPVISNSLVYNPNTGAGQGTYNNWKRWICKGYENQIEKWNSYGEGIGCSYPEPPAYCCSEVTWNGQEFSYCGNTENEASENLGNERGFFV